MTEINLNNFIELNNDKIDSTGVSGYFLKNITHREFIRSLAS